MSQQINLFNPLFLKQQKIFAAITMAQVLGVVLLACILISLYAGSQVKTRERQAADSAAQVSKLKARLEAASIEFAPHAADPALADKLQKSEDDVQSLQRVQDTLNGGGIGDTKGYSIYFKSFARQIVDGVWLTGVDINGAGQQIDLKGRTMRAELVPEYLKRLGREPEMKSKTFATLDMKVPLIDAPDSKVPLKVPATYIEFDLESLESNRKAESEQEGPIK